MTGPTAWSGRGDRLIAMRFSWKIALSLLAALLVGNTSFAAWEITRFEIYQGPPIDAPDRREIWEASQDPSRTVSLSDRGLAMMGWRSREEGEEDPDPAFAEVIPDLEKFLGEVAGRYSSLGLADPVANGWLDSVVRDKDGQLAIRIYLYRYSPKAPPAFVTFGEECGGGDRKTSRKVIHINTAVWAPRKDDSATWAQEENKRLIRGEDFASLAHELMHPVIQASPFMKGHCAVGKWISEGISDAISFDVTRSILSSNFGTNYRMNAIYRMKAKFRDSIGTPNGATKTFGLRWYQHPLQQHLEGENAPEDDAKKIHYSTSSFWRYLAETRYIEKRNPNDAYPTSRTNGGPGYSLVDYGYLVDLFNSRHPYMPAGKKQTNPLGDLRWVNEFLKSDKYFRTSAQRIFTRFISSMANYHVDRLSKAREDAGLEAPSISMERWMSVLFKDGEFEAGKTCFMAANEIGSPRGADMDVMVHPNAATCLMASPPSGPYPPGTMVDILVLGDELNVLKQLRIGLPDGSIESGPDIHSFMGGGAPYYARWSFPLSAVRDGTYILVNMAERPERTKRFTGNFRFNLSSWESSKTTVPQPPAQPPVKENSDGWRPSRRETVRKDAEASFKQPMENLVPMTSVKRSGYDKTPRCDEQKLRLNMCGPQLRINLQLSPFGVAGSFRGSAANSLYRDYMAMDGMNPIPNIQKYSANLIDAERQMDARDGDRIRIAIPKIEYGFTGNINNADIRVDRARSGTRDNEKDYRTTGPNVPRDNGNGEISDPPNGKVTIDEYSHYVLRGSFSGTLIDDKRDAAGNRVVIGDISGTFNIPSPFTGDENFPLVMEQFEDEMINSMLEMIPASQLPVQEMLEQAGAPPAEFCAKLDEYELRSLGLEESCANVVREEDVAATVPVICSCDCDRRQEEKPQVECQTQCEAAWQQCPSGAAELGADMAAEVANYRALMEAKGLPKDVQDGLVDAYIKMPEWQRKLTIQGFK